MRPHRIVTARVVAADGWGRTRVGGAPSSLPSRAFAVSSAERLREMSERRHRRWSLWAEKGALAMATLSALVLAAVSYTHLCVDGGKEVSTQVGEESGERHHHEGCEDARDDPFVVERPVEEAAVEMPKALEVAIESLVHAPDDVAPAVASAGVERDLRPEQVVHHGWDEGARQEVRRHHREDDRHPERGEE